MEKELQNMAEMYNMPVEQIQQILGSTAGIKEELKFNKAVQLLVDNSKTVEE